MFSIPYYYDVYDDLCIYLNNEAYKEKFYSKIFNIKALQYSSKANHKPLLIDRRNKLHRCRNNC